jgi:hypothetical protein
MPTTIRLEEDIWERRVRVGIAEVAAAEDFTSRPRLLPGSAAAAKKKAGRSPLFLWCD